MPERDDESTVADTSTTDLGSEVGAGALDDETVAPGSEIHDTIAPLVGGDRVSVRDSLVGVLGAGEVEANDTLVLFGGIGSLSGDARVLVGAPAALAFGLGLGAVLVLGHLLFGGARDSDDSEEVA